MSTRTGRVLRTGIWGWKNSRRNQNKKITRKGGELLETSAHIGQAVTAMADIWDQDV